MAPHSKESERNRVELIIALVKPFRVAAVVGALEEEAVEILGVTIREVKGFGRQKNRLPLYLGSEFNDSFLPKVELMLFVHSTDAAKVERLIVKHARTGRIGDGKILRIQGYHDFVA